MFLAPAHAFKCKSCDVFLRNVTKAPIEFKNDLCPQCGAPISAADIRPIGGNPAFDTLKLFPPHGMAFKNELGSEVSIRYERGREVELFQELQRQLQQWITPIVNRTGVPPQGQAGFVGNVSRAARSVPKVRIDEDGSVVFEESDGPPEAAKG
jgi:hypothetical protein